jgi:hypothetical protein
VQRPNGRLIQLDLSCTARQNHCSSGPSASRAAKSRKLPPNNVRAIVHHNARIECSLNRTNCSPPILGLPTGLRRVGPRPRALSVPFRAGSMSWPNAAGCERRIRSLGRLYPTVLSLSLAVRVSQGNRHYLRWVGKTGPNRSSHGIKVIAGGSQDIENFCTASLPQKSSKFDLRTHHIVAVFIY